MADEKDEKEEFKPEFDVVEEGSEAAKALDKAPVKDTKAGYEDDTRLSAEQRPDAEDDDSEDTSVTVDDGSQTAEQIAQKRERRKRERKAQKARQQQARERDARDLQYLRNRNAQLETKFGVLEQRLSTNEVAQIDGRIEQLKTARAEAEEVMARAIEANNGKDVVTLTRTLAELNAGLTRLANYKQKLVTEAEATAAEGGEAEDDQQTRRGQPVPEQFKKVVLGNINTFQGRHPWFKPGSGDEDSAIVAALDNAVKNEGYDPASKDYWIELEERMKRRLPERMKSFGAAAPDADDDDEDDEPPARTNGAKGGDKPKGGPRMANGSQTRGTGKQFMLSAERKAALVEAGVWDDPKQRDGYIRAYAKYDKENPASK